MSLAGLQTQEIEHHVSAPHVIRELPILVILPHSRCNCRCVMCDIWRIRQVREITGADLEPHMASLRSLKVRWVVFSGGEPLMHSDLSAVARMLHEEGIRTTLLTAGLTLARHADLVAENVDDVIVSLDGPREIHDFIRGVPDAYRRLEHGIQALRARRAIMPIHGRCTVQKANFRHLRATVEAAQELKLTSLSFLAADISSAAFNHSLPLPMGKTSKLALNPEESDELLGELERLISDCQTRISPNFVRESPEKLRRIGAHFRAQRGQVPFTSPRCNAPWVSAVIESDGAVRPCFFHRPFGNLHNGTLENVLNSDAAIMFRSQIDISQDPICQKCVCSLFLDRGVSDPLQSNWGNGPSDVTG
jgi:Fe-coproporphyrin III synthase